MGTRRVGLRDVSRGLPPARPRLTAPLRYLAIVGPEKAVYDFAVPAAVGICAWGVYMLIDPKPPIFGDNGLLKFTRDLLVMAVPFMVGALAAVAMGAPGPHLERRPVGAELYLDGQSLTLRQFVCYLLGYLAFLGLITLIAAYGAELLHDVVLSWTRHIHHWRTWIRGIGTFFLAYLLSSLAVTVFWSLYFLTDVVNRTET
jgi:hypothetical protein